MVLQVKPGYKTTEFWLTVIVTICGILLASGALGVGATAVVGAIMSGLTGGAYAVSRGLAKRSW